MAPTGLDAWREVCSDCGRVWALDDRRWVCRCGGLLDLVGPLADPLTGGSSGSPLTRYGAALPPGAQTADLGLVVSPVAELRPGVYVKADYEQPTGSFKDRGASVMIGVAAGLGVDAVVVDSSGNAGKAAAAHAARAGLACTVYVPAGTAAAKAAAIAAYGATVVEVPGGRQAAADAAQREVRSSGRWYASHVHQPLFHHGVKTVGFELGKQVERLSEGTVFVPAGNGTLVLGLWLGFGELVALGRMARRPAIVAVQAAACAPLAGRAVGDDPTAATGIAIPAPPRAAQIRGAVMASGGWIEVVDEPAIRDAQTDLASHGFEVEPTGAVAWAGLRAAGRRGAAVAVDAGGAPRPGAPAGPAVAVLTGR